MMRVHATRWALSAVLIVAPSIRAQEKQADPATCPMHAAHSTGSPADAKSPYAGQEARTVKSLSQDEIDGYLAGRGMGLARPAELNHYPGPRHVLDMAKELSLTEKQAAATQAIYDQMRASALSLGAAYVKAEERLDTAFARGSIDRTALSTLVQEAARLQGELRLVHLGAHVELRRVLTAEQIASYDALRGYHAH